MRKHNYVVGYAGDRQCVYGKDIANKENFRFVDLMTLSQAKKFHKKIYGYNHKGEKVFSKVYKLVEVKS